MNQVALTLRGTVPPVWLPRECTDPRGSWGEGTGGLQCRRQRAGCRESEHRASPTRRRRLTGTPHVQVVNWECLGARSPRSEGGVCLAAGGPEQVSASGGLALHL